MIDADFVEAVKDLAVGAAGPVTVAMPSEGDMFLLRQPGGGYIPAEVQPGRRKHIAKDITAVVEFAKRFMSIDEGDPSVIWFDRTAVRCLISDDDRRDTITFPLTFSPQLITLMTWEAGKPNKYKQRDAILLLRTMFKNCLGRTGNFLENLKHLKFNVNSESQGTVSGSRVSIGKEIVAQVQGKDTIPDDIILEVPIFASRFVTTQPIDVAIEIDAQNETIGFIPIPGAVEGAIALAEAKVGSDVIRALGESTVPVYYGSP